MVGRLRWSAITIENCCKGDGHVSATISPRREEKQRKANFGGSFLKLTKLEKKERGNPGWRTRRDTFLNVDSLKT